jgi:hypothetical protein
MTLSPEHELLKKTIARLLEIYAFSQRIDLHGFSYSPSFSAASAKVSLPI